MPWRIRLAKYNRPSGLQTSLHQGSINAAQYAGKTNAIIVSVLQVTAQKIICTTEFRGKNVHKEHATQRRRQDNCHYLQKRIAAKQTLTQTLQHRLRQSREEPENAPAHMTADHDKSLAKEKHELLRLQHQAKYKIVINTVASSAFILNHHRTSHHSIICPRTLMTTCLLTPAWDLEARPFHS